MFTLEKCGRYIIWLKKEILVYILEWIFHAISQRVAWDRGHFLGIHNSNVPLNFASHRKLNCLQLQLQQQQKVCKVVIKMFISMLSGRIRMLFLSEAWPTAKRYVCLASTRFYNNFALGLSYIGLMLQVVFGGLMYVDLHALLSHTNTKLS